MTEYVWAELRDELVERWADTPNAPLEQRILDVWEKHPQLVVDATEQIAERFDRGVVRSPWAVLAKHVEEAASVVERSDRPAKGERDRASVRQRASSWIRSVGIHFDHESEVEQELFGDFGFMRAFAGDAELRDELLTLWASERPRGEQVERESEERQRQQGEHYRRTRELEQARTHRKLGDVPVEDIDAALAGRIASPEPVAANTRNPFLAE